MRSVAQVRQVFMKIQLQRLIKLFKLACEHARMDLRAPLNPTFDIFGILSASDKLLSWLRYHRHVCSVWLVHSQAWHARAAQSFHFLHKYAFT